jgi:hypothetical protein
LPTRKGLTYAAQTALPTLSPPQITPIHPSLASMMRRREAFIVGVVVAPDDVPADNAALLLVGGVVGPVEREVPRGGELRFYAVYPGRIRRL